MKGDRQEDEQDAENQEGGNGEGYILQVPPLLIQLLVLAKPEKRFQSFLGKKKKSRPPPHTHATFLPPHPQISVTF